MPNIILGSGQLSGGYEIANSLRFNDGSSDYLNRTPSSAGSTRKITISFWYKKCSNGTEQTVLSQNNSGASVREMIRFQTTDAFSFYTNNGSYQEVKTNRVFRDNSAFYHIVISVDTTQATAADRVKIYVNGVEETSFATSNYPAQNFDFTCWNSTNSMVLGRDSKDNNTPIDGYMAEFVFIDGTALDPTSFGEFDEDSGIWKPINVSGLSFGTNGFYLDFENSSSLGADVSGNGNNFTVNNLTSIDQTTDTPTNNYCTLNPLTPDGSVTLEEGNLKVASIGDNDWRHGTIGGSFKWYAECKINVAYDGSGGGICIGAISEDGLEENNGGTFTGISNANAKWYTNSNDGKFQEGAGNNVSGENGFTRASTGDIVGVACDGANGKIFIHVNGTYLNSGDPVAGTGFIGGTTGYNGVWFPFSGSHLTKGQGSWNFGNPEFSISSGNSDANGYGNFEYSVPSGYYALNTKNLAEYG